MSSQEGITGLIRREEWRNGESFQDQDWKESGRGGGCKGQVSEKITKNHVLQYNAGGIFRISSNELLKWMKWTFTSTIISIIFIAIVVIIIFRQEHRRQSLVCFLVPFLPRNSSSILSTVSTTTTITITITITTTTMTTSMTTPWWWWWLGRARTWTQTA